MQYGKVYRQEQLRRTSHCVYERMPEIIDNETVIMHKTQNSNKHENNEMK